ncbi:MAG: LysE family transporter [Pseudomonadota bacterium]
MLLNPLIIPVGILIGILVAAPVGPVNVLCVQRSISRGMAGGLAAGLGAVFGDGLIALSAALGIGLVTGLVENYRLGILLIGGLVLLAFGFTLYRSEPQYIAPSQDGANPHDFRVYFGDIARTFFLTITNPGAVLGLFAIFGGIGTYVQISGLGEAMLMVVAIMTGSLLWWFVLSYLVSSFRHRFNAENLKRVNQIAGLALLVFGGVLLGEMSLELAGVVG